jgi:hypothetical protein
MKSTCGALGLVLNAIVVWNPRYMGHALDDLRTAGMPINPEDVERLSPLLHHRIHLDGRYTFVLPEAVAHGELRPLRDPTDPRRAGLRSARCLRLTTAA